MMITFTFSVYQEAGEAVFSGNITPQQALQVLLGIVVAETIKEAKEKSQPKDSPS